MRRSDAGPPTTRPVLALAALALAFAMPVATAHAAGDTVEGPARATDGDTVVVGGRTVDLFGVVAPALDQDCLEWRGRRQTRYPCGRHALALLASLVAGRTVVCVMTERPVGNGREGTCYTDGRDLAETLVTAGWAVARAERTNRYVATQERARAAKRGLWAGSFALPRR